MLLDYSGTKMILGDLFDWMVTTINDRDPHATKSYVKEILIDEKLAKHVKTSVLVLAKTQADLDE